MELKPYRSISDLVGGPLPARAGVIQLLSALAVGLDIAFPGPGPPSWQRGAPFGLARPSGISESCSVHTRPSVIRRRSSPAGISPIAHPQMWFGVAGSYLCWVMLLPRSVSRVAWPPLDAAALLNLERLLVTRTPFPRES